MGSFFILTLAIYTLVISVLWIFLTEIMFKSDFEAYTGYTYDDYLNTVNREGAEIYIITKKMIGVLLLALGLLIFIINKYGYSKGEQWSWYAVLIAGAMSWGTFIIYKLVINYIGISMITFVVGAALLAVGLTFPAKDILAKKST